MPMPAGITTVTVTGRYVHPDGTPFAGKVTFATPALVQLSEAETIAVGSSTFDLDASGTFTAVLVATDNTNMQPTEWAYQVTEQLTGPGASPRTYWIDLPSTNSPADLAKVAPADPARGSYVLVPGPTGPAGADGADGNTILSGSGAPVPAEGIDGDYWMDVDITTLWGPKASGAWPASGVPLTGGSGVSDALNTHIAATTNVHGIADTAALETQTGAANKVAAHAAAADPHGDRAYADGQIAALSALTQYKVKTADETRTATITVADDLHLVATLDANSVYRFRATLLFDGPETADATIVFTAPAGASGGWSPVAGTLGTTVPDGAAQLKMAAHLFGSSVDVGVMASSASLAGLMVLPHGVVVTGSTPGQLRLRWAQQTSNASPVTLKAGSTLEVVKVSGSGPSASGINLDFPASYPSDQGLLAWTYDPDIAGHVTAQSSAGVAGRITLTKIQIRKTITWSNVWLGLSGVDTAAALTNCYVGVYNASGTLMGTTADLSATFVNAANAKAIALPLTAAFTAPPGEYFIAMLLNGTWGTNVLHFKSSGAGISVNANLTPPRLRYSNLLSGQTALPASIDLSQQSTSLINTGWASQWYAVS